jgi:molybdopterin/thiamine biosynthesis adenylyltransferase
MLQKSIKDKLSTDNQTINKNVHYPIFYDLNQKNDENELHKLLTSLPNLIILDEIDGQIEELIKLRNPKTKLTPKELKDKVKTYLNNTPKEQIGVWVYYPWLNKLIHLLSEKEFIEVRTNRNQYKITPQEEDILATKTIGIIGLSVGKAIATTIAMERICGELIIADFDVIELSNLNRIQTGVQNFNQKKTIVVAREIAEIDPYLKVSCLSDGLTEENMNEFFFSKGKKIDLCIEVCDGLSTKIYARQKAKELGIPVVMNSSDRGTTDVERFDLDKTLPILHGLVDHLDLNLVKEAKTNEEKVPYLLPMLGIETSSERLKASMLEIEQTITTWPQLASGVIMGGGICTDVCRRILLNQFTNSGRYFVDVEEQINNDVTDYISASNNQEEKINLTPKTNIEDYRNLFQEANEKLFINNNESCELTNSEVTELIKYAIMAPTAGNIQPWKWIYKNKKLFLLHDKKRAESILNYRDTASLMGLGASAENVILKAHQMGYEVKINKFPLGFPHEVYADFEFFDNNNIEHLTIENHFFDELVHAIPKRITNRTLNKRIPLKNNVEKYLQSIIQSIAGAELKIFTSDEKIEALKEIITEIDWIIMTNKGCHKQFMHEIRWNSKEVEETKDGLDLDTFDITPTERAGLMVARNWNVTKHAKKWGLGKSFGKMSKKAIESSSALGLITMPKVYPEAYFDGGRAIQKVWLGATIEGVSFQPLSLSTFLSERIADNNFEGLEDVKAKIIDLYTKLKVVCEIKDGLTDIFLFRLCYADDPKVKPLRRPIEDVLIYE